MDINQTDYENPINKNQNPLIPNFSNPSYLNLDNQQNPNFPLLILDCHATEAIYVPTSLQFSS